MLSCLFAKKYDAGMSAEPKGCILMWWLYRTHRPGVLLWVMLCLLAVVTPRALEAQEAVQVRLAHSSVAFDAGQLSILEDAGHQLSWQEALAAQKAGMFRPIPYGVGEGYNSSVFWVYTRLERSEDAPDFWAFISSPAYLDRVDYHVLQQGRLLTRLSAGDMVADPAHDLHHRLPVVGTSLPVGSFELLIRLETSSTAVLLVQAVPENQIRTVIEGRLLSEGVLIGILLIVLIINLINGIWLRRSLFFYFVAYELSMLITILLSNGYARDMIIGMTVEQQNLLMQLCVIGSGCLAFVFFQRMLNFVFVGAFWINILFGVGIALGPAGVYFALNGQYHIIMVLINAYVSLFPLVVSIPLMVSWKKMNAEQKFRAGGFFVFGIFVIVNAMYTVGYMPVTVGTTYIAPVMVLSFQLSLHFIIMFSVRKSERTLLDAQRKMELFGQEVEHERSQRRFHEMFMAMFSHEVRTPLAVIDTATQSLQLLERKRSASELFQQRYLRIRAAVERINQLLKMSLLRSSHEFGGTAESDLVVKKYDVSRLLAGEIQEFSQAEQERICWADPVAELPFRSRMPAILLGVVIRNLIDNALKYSPEDCMVDVNVTLAGGQLELGIRDYGPGMSDYTLEHMFERHFRAGEREAVPGLGLGLFIVKEVIDQYQGRIEVKTDDKGTCMTCYFMEEKT